MIFFIWKTFYHSIALLPTVCKRKHTSQTIIKYSHSLAHCLAKDAKSCQLKNKSKRLKDFLRLLPNEYINIYNYNYLAIIIFIIILLNSEALKSCYEFWLEEVLFAVLLKIHHNRTQLIHNDDFIRWTC